MIQFLFIFSDWGLLILRFVLGLIMAKHGFPKMKDLKTTGASFGDMGFKPGRFWGTLVALAEVAGGLALILGFLTQIFAVILLIEFVVILLKVKRKAGFVGGYEFELLIFAALFLLVLFGAGSRSLDWALGLVVF